MDAISHKVRRSLLFAPANRPDIVAKAATLSTDVVIIELEDGVSIQHKKEARNNLEQLLAATEFGQRETAIRINRITTRHGLSDLLAIADLSVKPDLLVVPKVESADEIRLYDELLNDCSISSKLLVLIESSKGLINAHRIASGNDRVAAIMLGAVDLAAELGCELSWEFMAGYRSTLIRAGGYAGIPVIDSPNIMIKDIQLLEEECAAAKQCGFSGKLCIHPSQLDTVNTVFSPTSVELSEALKIVQAAESSDNGAIVVEGRMVDAPVLKSARRILAIAEQIGMSLPT